MAASSDAGRGDRIAVVGLVAAAVAAGIAIGPVADLPLIDDWAYALPVQSLVEDGRLRFTDWQSMPLVTQVAWGALFAWPGGFSFTALRLSTLVLGAIGALGVHALLRSVGAPVALAAIGGLSFLANPIYLCLSATFMTDVPFFALAIWSLALLVRGLGEDRPRLRFAGHALALLATLLRQVGLAIPLAWAIVAFVRHAGAPRRALPSLVPLAITGAALFGYEAALEATLGLPSLYPLRGEGLSQAIGDLVGLRLGVLRYPIERSLQGLLYVGAFLVPLALVAAAAALRDLPRRHAALALALLAAIAAAATAALAAFDAELPRLGNVLLNLGVGPRSLPGEALPHAPRALWIALTFAACLSASALVWGLGRLVAAGVRGVAQRAPTTRGFQCAFLALVGAIYFAPLSMAYGPFFDRYFLPLAALVAPLAAAGLASRAGVPRGAIAAATALAIALLGFSIAATHDYLAWNRARWAAASHLERDLGVAAAEIDGGFEYNNYLPHREALGTRGLEARIERPASRFAVTLAPRPGERVIRAFPAEAWLPFAVEQVYAVERMQPNGAPSAEGT
jgi:hypothetical protein